MNTVSKPLDLSSSPMGLVPSCSTRPPLSAAHTRAFTTKRSFFTSSFSKSSLLEDGGLLKQLFRNFKKSFVAFLFKIEARARETIFFFHNTQNKKSTTILKLGFKSQKPKRNHQRVKGQMEV
ncbi:hypothetical protein H5410_044172 [Solanum commersonii]|uniref:Uncharacterized protein n=1 Tax=Solanum commersonii TaxID=4109 RepID=A0A9J5X7A3_SOLCO|nr:hypothetical protein H5410_044172 [Solanum commersonii]